MGRALPRLRCAGGDAKFASGGKPRTFDYQAGDVG
jgi:hypothetical protein